MSRYILDIETNTSFDTIWLAVTKDIDTGEIICHTEASSLKSLVTATDTIIGHNVISFDAPILNRLWNMKIRSSQVEDTLVMSRLANPVRENGHSLDAWGKRLGFHKIEFSDYNGGLTPEMQEYCIRDVEVTELVYKHLQKELEGFDKKSIDIEHKVQAIISKQERHGFRFDIIKATKLNNQLTDRMNEILTELQSVFPPIVEERYSEKTGKRLKDSVTVFNPASRQQIADRLMKLGWKPKKHTDKGSVIVDESVLEGVNIPEAKLIAEYLMLQKRISQLAQWFDNCKANGRVYGKVITLGAITGRMSHHSPNMAQIPNSGSPYGHECRELWTVDDGNVLVGADASGLELRMLAHYMQDSNYTKAVIDGKSEDGTDIHTVNQKAAGLDTRNQAKTFIYAFLYGAGSTKIGSIVGGNAQKGQQLIDKFLQNTPALKKLKEKVADAAEKGWLRGLDGRKLWVRSAHAALNTLLQGAGAIVMKQALILLHDELLRGKIPANFCANVHDEWQIETKPEYADVVGRLAVDSIKKAGEVLGLRCPLDGEYKIGTTWKMTH